MRVALTLLCLAPLFGCHSLAPLQQARQDRFQCQANALAKVVEPTLDAVELLKDLYAGRADLGVVLGSVAATQAEVQTLLAALRDCGTDVEQVPAEEPALLQTSW